ncbi:ferredoxin [Symbioplanes lichenis]|uniref:ferredoxin n=1 Tax=Symbioplanes lichenis TaxID=1629072 RepID=UPI00273A183B|nr:ferredoxin [Actinoplanes lichenis]
MTSWRVEVTPDCIASGVCLALAGDDFALGDDGRTHPLREVTEEREAVLDAAASCPMEAILLTDATTGEPVDF